MDTLDSDLKQVKSMLRRKTPLAECVELLDAIHESMRELYEVQLQRYAAADLEGFICIRNSRLSAVIKRFSSFLGFTNELDASPSAWAKKDGGMSADFVATRAKICSVRLAFLRKVSNIDFDGNNLHKKRHLPDTEIAKRTNKKVLIICNSYPTRANVYGGGFIKVRAEAYLRYGWEVSVYVVNPNATSDCKEFVLNDVKVRLGTIDDLGEYARQSRASNVTMHSPCAAVFLLLTSYFSEKQITVFCHGYEARNYDRLIANFSKRASTDRLMELERVNFQRLAFLRYLFEFTDIKVVFVSSFLKKISSNDVGFEPKKFAVIPNAVDDNIFKFSRKSNSQRFTILIVRPFLRANYAADLIVKVILLLSKEAVFPKLHFELHGFGRHFSSMVQPLRRFQNVSIQEGVLSQSELAAAFNAAGIFLCPSRHDTQGVTLCEAMSCGLVCVSNSVGGIPEYVLNGILIDDFDPEAMANACLKVIKDPKLFDLLSTSAAESSGRLVSARRVIPRELNFIDS